MESPAGGFSDFSVDFYQAWGGDPQFQDENLFLSTGSIENAMTWAGARNQTASQMASIRHLDRPRERFHPALKALSIDIDHRDDPPTPLPSVWSTRPGAASAILLDPAA